jgi:hypothetical protein
MHLGSNYAPIRGLAITKEHEKAVCISLALRALLEVVLVSRLVTSPPVWQYELGSLAASSLVTPSQRLRLQSLDRVVPV